MIFDIVQFYLFCFFLIFPHIACPDLPWPLKNLLRFLYKFRPNQKIHGLRNLPNRNDSFSENTREILPPRVKPRKKKHPTRKKKKTSAEVGIIDEELVKNLAICGAVILVVIFALVPNPRIAIWVPVLWVEDGGNAIFINERDSR